MSSTLRIKPSDSEQGEFILIDPASFNADIHTPFDDPNEDGAHPLFDGESFALAPGQSVKLALPTAKAEGPALPATKAKR